MQEIVLKLIKINQLEHQLDAFKTIISACEEE